jgi:uncharacterized transporter YbjL
VRIGTILGRIRIRGFAIGATACTVIVAAAHESRRHLRLARLPAVSGACDVAESQTPVLGVAVPYAIANVFLTMLGPIIGSLTLV